MCGGGVSEFGGVTLRPEQQQYRHSRSCRLGLREAVIICSPVPFEFSGETLYAECESLHLSLVC